MALIQTRHNTGFRIQVTGLVQGVGFRPFIYRLAKHHQLTGWVLNSNDGVLIQVQGEQKKLTNFIHEIRLKAPPAATVIDISYEETPVEKFNNFQIKSSASVSNSVTLISPDIAICQDCLEDMEQQAHRLNYPLINCTNCGPRFSIIQALPYDRPKTTMADFPMCQSCEQEYNNIIDRRFHAQPIACNDCGPSYCLDTGKNQVTELDTILSMVSSGLDQGQLFAIKGTGGYHLACDAHNEKAVQALRQLKRRDRKPFAVLVRSLGRAKEIAHINVEEESILLQFSRPIVLLRSKQKLAPGVSYGLNRVGVMLPYMPVHHLLFEQLETDTLVLTSGNFSDEPIVIDDDQAREQFLPWVTGVLSYNRIIHNRVDDSVMKVTNQQALMIRRSRGFAPAPLVSQYDTEGIFAAGAELSSSFAIGKGNQVILSQFLGDLKGFENFAFYEESYQRFSRLFNFIPNLIAVDAHSGYLSTSFGRDMAKSMNAPYITIQHHHAHIASVLLEKSIQEPVIGISLDGLGMGSDQTLWGAEFMYADLDTFERCFHFRNVSLPGGDRAAKQPWRMALSYLHQSMGSAGLNRRLPLFSKLQPDQIQGGWQLLENDINCPQTSSAGRLFDAVAALCGISFVNHYQAEAPMLLEAAIDESVNDRYPYSLENDHVVFDDMIQAICLDVEGQQKPGSISAKFHNTLVAMITEIGLKMKTRFDTSQVVLSGGTFQNHYLLKHLYASLSKNGMTVHLPKITPINDQGIAIGQMAIAAYKRKIGNIS